MSEYKVAGTLRAKFIKNQEQLEIRAIGWKAEQYHGVKICYLDVNNAQAIFPEFTYDSQKNHFFVTHGDLSPMKERIRLKWKLCIQYIDEGGQAVCKRLVNIGIARKIKGIVDESQSQSFRYGESIYEFVKNHKRYVVLPYYTVKGRMGFVVRQKQRSLIPVVKAKVNSCSIDGSILTIRGNVRKEGYRPDAMVLCFRNEKEEQACEYLLDTQSERMDNGRFLMTGRLDLSNVSLKPIYWDLMLRMRKDTVEPLAEDDYYYVNMYNTSQSFKDQFLRLRQEIAYRCNGNIFFPFVTKKDTLGFKYREISKADSMWFRLKERIARKIYEMNPQYWNKKKIYLVYEKYCMGAQDNGYYFFRYCMKHKKKAEKDARFYYVIDRSSKEYSKVAPYGKRVVNFLSIRHMIYLQAAKVLISTDSKAHAYAWRQKGSVLYPVLDQKKLVFLQHGVIGLKDVSKMYGHNSKAGCDLFIASSQKEKEVIHEHLKYRNKDIVITGLARWDEMVDKSEGHREILVMPTWRGWLDSVSEDDFCQSEYYKNYQELLMDDRIYRFLEEKDYHMTFYLHPILKEFIHKFSVKGDRIRLVSVGEEPLNEIIMRSSMMITDYSSASWDMYYMKKPVIFFHFDVEDYIAVHGSYMDFEKDLFGDRAGSVSELYECLLDTVSRKNKLKPEYLAKWDTAFAYVDHNNSKRILQQIVKRNWTENV